MEANYGIRGRSLLVPSVVELAKQSLPTVPSQYLHEGLETDSVPKITPIEQFPVISLASLLQDDPAEFTKLGHACRHWGFFQVVGHGVSEELIERFKMESKEFLELPMEDKSKFWQTLDDMEGFGQNFVVSNEQKLDWADSFFITILPRKERRPHLLPLLPLPFRETLESYAGELKQLAMKMFNCIAKDLKIEKEHLIEMFGDGRQTMRISHYPPCPQSDKVIGLRPHSDVSGLTILLQLNPVEGLEIRKDGRWLRVVPLPHAFIVNLGDAMEIVSNGIYRSVEHRAMVNPTMERLSAATFFQAGSDSEIGPAPSLVSLDTPARFKRITTSAYLNGFYTRPLNGKSYLDTIRIPSSQVIDY